jgi:hypothetical protein
LRKEENRGRKKIEEGRKLRGKKLRNEVKEAS